MKRLIAFAAVLLLSASTAFATDVASGAAGAMDLTNSTGFELHGDHTTATLSTALIGKCSTGVGISWQTSINAYALATQHKSGTKAYGSSYDSTAIYVVEDDLTPGTEVDDLTASDTSDFLSGWKKL